MERRLNKKTETYITSFKDNIRDVAPNVLQMNNVLEEKRKGASIAGLI